jgi:uncharacterized membrane protein YphA (DoxX/SURF4 family)
MRRYADLLLRVALAFSLIYPPFSALSDASNWIGYIPLFALRLWPWSALSLLHTFGVVEVVLALWILSGWKIWMPSALAGFILLVIVLTNADQFIVLFRDLSIAGLAFGLALRHFPKRTEMIA